MPRSYADHNVAIMRPWVEKALAKVFDRSSKEDPAMPDTFIVICLGNPGDGMTLATRRVFTTRADAQAYAATISHSRYPAVISGRFADLRFPYPCKESA